MMIQLAFIATVLSTPGSPAAAMKCPPDTPVPFPNAPEVVYVVDGKVVDRNANSQEVGSALTRPGIILARELRLDAKSVVFVGIVCADELHRRFGVESRRGGVLVHTRSGSAEMLTSSMQSIVLLQRDYVARHGVFATNLNDLGWKDPSGLITVTLSVARPGERWSAVGSHRYLTDKGQEVTVSGER